MATVVDAPHPHSLEEIQAELAQLRRRIAELEQEKSQLTQPAGTPAATPVDAAPVDAAPAASSDELAQTLHAFVRRVAKILQAEKCLVLLYEAGTGELVAQHPALRFTPEEVAKYRLHAGDGLSGEAFREGKPVICHACATDPRGIEERLDSFGVRDSLTVPMVVERRNERQQVIERQTIGIINVFNKRYGLKFSEEDIRLLTVLARNASAMIASTQATKTADSEKKQLEYTLQSMSSGLLVVSRSGEIQLINPAGARVLSVEMAAATGAQYRQVIGDAAIVEFLAQALNQGQDISQEFQIAERFYQTQTSAVRDEHGMAVGLLCIFSDVTELRNVERMKTDFVSTVSHELRTPLTAIKGFIRTLIDDPTGEFYDQEMRMEFYGIIDSECDRLTRLISDLLNVSRIERGLPLQLNYSSVNVPEIVEHCVSFQRSYTTLHTLVTELPEALDPIEVDKDKLDQVLTNLLSNAIKYSPDGGTITVRVTDEGETLRFSVSDQGMGIPADHLDKVFQRFHRVHSGDSQRVGGTGLGLFLTKTLVETHGGLIWVESTLGQGSSFFFTLPKHPPTAQA